MASKNLGWRHRQPGPDEEIIYRPFVTLRNGRRIYASQYGLVAFPLVVRKRR